MTAAKARKRNRGPAAAPDNRRAILAAARPLFAERGYHVPLSAIAQRAGVGQAVFYRHFPTRYDLAFAVFEESFADLEAIATESDPAAFGRLWARLLDLTVETAAFVEMVAEARRTLPEYDGPERLLALVGAPLERAQAAGLVDPAITPFDVLLAQRMLYGVVVTTPDPSDARASVDQAAALLGW